MKMFLLWQVVKSRLKLRIYIVLRSLSQEKKVTKLQLFAYPLIILYNDFTKFYSCDFVIRDKVQL